MVATRDGMGNCPAVSAIFPSLLSWTSAFEPSCSQSSIFPRHVASAVWLELQIIQVLLNFPSALANTAAARHRGASLSIGSTAFTVTSTAIELQRVHSIVRRLV